MSEFIETVKVVCDNEQGFYIKNLCALTDDDVIFGQEAKAPAEGDRFDAMDFDALKTYLTENGQTPHHLTKEATLRAAARKLASDLI